MPFPFSHITHISYKGLMSTMAVLLATVGDIREFQESLAQDHKLNTIAGTFLPQ